jgi:hypothetical protein
VIGKQPMALQLRFAKSGGSGLGKLNDDFPVPIDP